MDPSHANYSIFARVMAHCATYHGANGHRDTTTPSNGSSRSDDTSEQQLKIEMPRIAAWKASFGGPCTECKNAPSWPKYTMPHPSIVSLTPSSTPIPQAAPLTPMNANYLNPTDTPIIVGRVAQPYEHVLMHFVAPWMQQIGATPLPPWPTWLASPVAWQFTRESQRAAKRAASLPGSAHPQFITEKDRQSGQVLDNGTIMIKRMLDRYGDHIVATTLSTMTMLTYFVLGSKQRKLRMEILGT
jgi:hypothetical protein